MRQNIKNKFEIILKNFILLQPIIDLITAISINCLHLDVTLGIIIRTIFLILVMYATVFIYDKKKIGLYYFFVILYSILFLIGVFIYKDGYNLLGEIQGLLKTFYFPILLVSLYNIRKEVNIDIKWVTTMLCVYILLIFIPNLFNIGFDSYKITKEGHIGFFNSANEIGAIISILTPLIFLYMEKNKNIIKKIFLFIIYMVVILSIGTKSPLLSLIITVAFYIIWYVVKYFREKEYKKIGVLLISLFSITFFLILLLPRTNFYKNIETHLEYLKVNSVKEVLKEPELIDHFIFSQRLTFLENKNNIYVDSSIYEKIIGIGYYNNEKQTKMIEMDYFDIYYSHGIIGFILFFTPYTYILVNTIKKKKNEDISFENYMNVLSILLILMLSLFTGHIITAPAVSFVAICIILLSNKKQLLIASYNLGFGGIERSLVTLLHNLDYDKYKVTLALERKEGIYLKEIPKDITLVEYRVNDNKNVFIRKIINLLKKIKWAMFNYNQFDASFCYATYSLPCDFLAKISSKNSFLFVHSNYTHVYKSEDKLREFFDTRKICNYNKIIFVSNEAKNDLLKFYQEIEEKSYVINNLVDYEMILRESKKKIKLKKTKKTFLFVGRLDEQSKKISRIIETANNLKENKMVEFWIIGDGPNKKDSELLIKKYKLTNVKMLGAQHNPYPYIKLCDYLILTSDYEGFPVVYNEAIVLNKPILTTIDVSDDYIKIPKRFGLIMNKNTDDITKKIKQILDTGLVVSEKVNFKEINKKRIVELENLIDEVV